MCRLQSSRSSQRNPIRTVPRDHLLLAPIVSSRRASKHALSSDTASEQRLDQRTASSCQALRMRTTNKSVEWMQTSRCWHFSLERREKEIYFIIFDTIRIKRQSVRANHLIYDNYMNILLLNSLRRLRYLPSKICLTPFLFVLTSRYSSTNSS